MKKLFILAFVLVASRNIFAQPSQTIKDKIDSQRIAFITQRLQLTPDEAQKFWPVYNQYHNEVDKLRETRAAGLLNAKAQFDTYTDAQVKQLIDDELNSRQQELDIIRKYTTQFEAVLPMKKVAMLYKAEADFKIQLLQNFKNQSQGN